jgi:hypothetical protein
MSKQSEVSIGQNVTFTKDNQGRFHFIVDPSNDGPQTKGSKGLDNKGKPKKPNEMVGSTGSYMTLPVTDENGRECSVMLHLTRPMSVTSVRQARALRELAEDEAANARDQQDKRDTVSPLTVQDKLTIRKLGLSEAEVLAAAQAEDIEVAALLAVLSE